MYMRKLLISAILFCSSQIFAQQDSSKGVLASSVNYQNKLHFFGRIDSLESSGLFPVLNYEFASGWYGQSAFIYLQNNTQPLKYAGTVLELGYRFKNVENFNGNIFYNHFLYGKDVPIVQATLKSQLGFNSSLRGKVVNFNINSSLLFSDKTDLTLTTGLDHLFIIKTGGNTALAINPTANLNAGTQQFSKTYTRRTNFLGIPRNEQVTETTAAFNILSYELSAPIVFVAGKFNASIIPTYVMPKNLQPSEFGKNLFVLTLSAGVRL